MVNRKAQQGLSLVELLIATSTGLLLLGCLIQTMYSSSLTYSVFNHKTELKHTGQVTTDYMIQLIYHAGFWGDITFTKQFAQEEGFERNAFITGVDNHIGSSNYIDGSDSIQVRMAGAEDSRIVLCNKDVLPDYKIAFQKFFITKSSTDSPTLACTVKVYALDKNTGGKIGIPEIEQTIHLMEQIETLQVLYAVGTEDALRWVKADEVTDWTAVSMVDIWILVGLYERMYDPLATPKTFKIFEKIVTVTNEKTPMQVFSRSVLIRNSSALTGQYK